MMNRITKITFIVTFLILCFLFNICMAEEAKPKCLTAIEGLIGFGKAKLKEKGNYYLTPLMFDFDFDLKPFLKKRGFSPPGLFQFQLEPFMCIVSKPDANVELGNAFMFKVGVLPETAKFQPYAKAGVGMLYMSQHTREQATQFNFLEQGGIGAHYFFNKNMAFTAECRIRHLSNAGIKQPNHGVNTLLFVLGTTYKF